MRIGVIHPDSGWILSTIAKRMCEAKPDVFEEWPYESLKQVYVKDLEAVDAWYYVDIQSCWTLALRKVTPKAKHVGMFTHLDKDKDASGKARWLQLDGVVHMCYAYHDRFAQNGWFQSYQMTVLRPGEVHHIPLTPIRLGIVQRGEFVGKGSEFLPAVLDKLPDHVRSALRLDICGRGWVTDDCGEFHGVPYVQYPEDDFAAMPTRYDYLFIPSLWEGGPMCLLEALAAGKSVIGARVGWVGDILWNAPSGRLLFMPGNVAEAVHCITEVVEERRRLRAKVEHMSYRQYADDVQEFITQLKVSR